jgi:hypothetical protein
VYDRIYIQAKSRIAQIHRSVLLFSRPGWRYCTNIQVYFKGLNNAMKDPSELFAKGISEAALCAIARNSIRHFLDSDEHFRKQRFASALASAVFSIEECGKLYFVALTGKGNQTHKMKQIFFAAMLKFVVSQPWWSMWRTVVKNGLTADTVLSEGQLKDIADHPELAAVVEAARAGQFDDPEKRRAAFVQAAIHKEQRDGTTDRWLPVIDGLLNKLRMQATYVDVAENGEAVSDPSRFDAETTEFLCAGALGLLTISYGLMRSRLIGVEPEFKKMILADDLTGQATVRKVMQPFVDAYERSHASG